MSKQASNTIIGGFIVGAIALIIIGVTIFGSGEFFKETYQFVLYFDGSVKGLNAGAPVVFRGVEVGSVSRVVLRIDPKEVDPQIPVIIEIYPDKVEFKDTLAKGEADLNKNMPILVEKGLKFRLVSQSLLTGQLMIESDFYPDNPIRLVGTDLPYTELPTISSTIEELSKLVQDLPIQEIFSKLLSVIEGLKNVVDSPEIPKILKSANLAISEAGLLLNNIDQQLKPLTSIAKNTLNDYAKLARDVNAHVDPVALGLDEVFKKAHEVLKQTEKTLIAVEDVVSEDSSLAYELENALKDISDMANSVQLLANYLERHPEALLKGKGSSGGE